MITEHPFKWPIRIYYEDTDAGGVVYHANYIKYFERARTELLRCINVNQKTLLEQSIAFVVTNITIDFVKPARLDNELTVTTVISGLRRASMSFEQALINFEGTVLCRALVKVACVDLRNMKPQPIPLSITSEILSER